jgi:hypothetical protein
MVTKCKQKKTARIAFSVHTVALIEPLFPDKVYSIFEYLLLSI